MEERHARKAATMKSLEQKKITTILRIIRRKRAPIHATTKRKKTTENK